MNTKSYAAGDVIFREGDESNEAFRVVSGAVEILIRTPRGLKPVAQLHTGEIFGEMGLVDEKPRSATAKALEALEVEVIDESNFEEAILGNRERLHDYLSTMFERLRTTDVMLELAIRREMGFGKPRVIPNQVSSEDEVTPSLEIALHDELELEVGEGEAPAPAAAPAGGQGTLTLSSDALGNIVIDKFPYRIGRETEGGPGPFVRNDLTIADDKPYQISRNHCAIERDGDSFIVRDRGSTLGTIVNGRSLRVRNGEITARLKPGTNEIILGEPLSKHRLQLVAG